MQVSFGFSILKILMSAVFELIVLWEDVTTLMQINNEFSPPFLSYVFQGCINGYGNGSKENDQKEKNDTKEITERK